MRQLLDILCNSANKPSFSKSRKRPFCPKLLRWKKCQILKRWFISWITTKTSRSCIFSLFLAHKYQVSLIMIFDDYHTCQTVPIMWYGMMSSYMRWNFHAPNTLSDLTSLLWKGLFIILDVTFLLTFMP